VSREAHAGICGSRGLRCPRLPDRGSCRSTLGVKGSQVQILSSRRHDGRCASLEVHRLLLCLSWENVLRGRS
jgi:hypothetical protein